MKKNSADIDRRGQTQPCVVALRLHHLLLHYCGVWVFAVEIGVGCNWGCWKEGWASAVGATPKSGENGTGCFSQQPFTFKETFQAEYSQFKS